MSVSPPSRLPIALKFVRSDRRMTKHDQYHPMRRVVRMTPAIDRM